MQHTCARIKIIGKMFHFNTVPVPYFSDVPLPSIFIHSSLSFPKSVLSLCGKVGGLLLRNRGVDGGRKVSGGDSNLGSCIGCHCYGFCLLSG